MRERILSYAALATVLIGTTFAIAPFIGSLKPSAKAEAVRGQGQFEASQLDDLAPGDVRLIVTGLGVFWVVVPTDEMMSDLELSEDHAIYRSYETYDEQLDAFVLWSVSPKKRGAPCTVRHMDKDPNGDGMARFGGFFDPCSGAQFDYAGRVSIPTSNNNVRNLKRPELERIFGDTYQITNPEHLSRY